MTQHPLAMWLRGLSIGLFIGITVSFPSCFPYSFSALIICWVIAGIYEKWRTEQGEQKAHRESPKQYNDK